MSDGTSQPASKSTFEMGQAQPLVDDLKRAYGERTKFAVAKRPGEGERDSQYRGYVVHIDDKWIAQRVDHGSIETSIVLHDRSQLTVPPNRNSGQEAGIKGVLDRNTRGVDLTVTYRPEGPGEIYGRNRDAENARFTAIRLKQASPLEGAKRAVFEKQVDEAAKAYSDMSFNRLRGNGKDRTAERSAQSENRAAAPEAEQPRRARAR